MADDITEINTKIFTDEQIKFVNKVVEDSEKTTAKALNVPSTFYVPRLRETEMLHVASKVRDYIWNYPVLNSALFVYQQIATSRDWQVSGKPRAALRSVEWLNNAEIRNPHDGRIEYGFESYLKRRVIDYTVVGRTAFYVKNKGRSNSGALQYLDPTKLRYNRPRSEQNRYVQPDDRVWTYPSIEGNQLDLFTYGDVVIHHPLPMGVNRFLSPVMMALPTATLAALLQEYDNNALDGRKVRDILLVSTQIADTIKTAVKASIALHSGEGVDDVGIPVIPINTVGGQKAGDMFALLGLSKIPENFDRQQFMFSYANIISAVLGLSLRHFWQGDSQSNKALEVVQEARQQQKGPAAFVRSEQRLINNSGALTQFDSGGVPARFGFVEEIDVATKRANASMLRDYSEAVKNVQEAVGMRLEPNSFLAWMQDLGLLGPNQEFVDAGEMQTTLENPDEVNAPEPGGLADGEPEASSQTPSTKSKVLNYDEISVNQDGEIVEKRHKVFNVVKYLANVPLEDDLQDAEVEEDLIPFGELDLFSKSLQAEHEKNIQFLRDNLEDMAPQIEQFAEQNDFYSEKQIKRVVELTKNGGEFSEDEMALVSILIETVSDAVS